MELRHRPIDPQDDTNRVIKILRDKGLVYDDRLTENAKKYSIHLTKDGRLFADDILDEVERLNELYFEGISKCDVLLLRNTLVKLSNNLSRDSDDYVQPKISGLSIYCCSRP